MNKSPPSSASPTAVKVSKASKSTSNSSKTTNLSRSAASSNQSLNSASASETTSASTVKTTNIRRSPSSNEILTENIDDFAIGDRVWVNGQRPGIIRFIGDTQFAPGIWSGIELEDDEGKNDGSVGGVRYFTCKPKYGVFVRPQRLTTQQINHMNGASKNGSPKNGASPSREVSPPLSTKNGKENGQFSSANIEALYRKFQVGDRILVNATSGTKLGTLMFLGPTEFATGLWAGVELDEAVGKNDGSVAGKRYFDCEMKYGLFAPVLKISPAPLSALRVIKKGATVTKKSGINRQKSGSQESLASVSSTASSTYRSNRVRLGVNSLASSTQKVSGQSKSSSGSSSVAANLSATTVALHGALKEKEEHIEQLLKERDLERGEISRAASQAEELEEKLANLQQEHNKVLAEADEEITELKRLNQEYEEENLKLSTQLDDERKKTEDFQFRTEEDSIIKTDLEFQIDTLKQNIESLELQITSKTRDATKSDNERIESLTEHIKNLEAQKEQETFSLQEDLVRKEEQCLQLEVSLESRKTELTNLHQRIIEFEHELEISKKKSERQLEAIDELNYRLKKEESQRRGLIEENTALKTQVEQKRTQMRSLEEKYDEMSVGKNEITAVNDRIKQLEKELLLKEEIEKTLEENLIETKQRYEAFESEVQQLAEELKKMRQHCDDESRRRKTAEDKAIEIEGIKRHLEEKIESIMHTSGTNSDLMVKLNDEFVERQKEYDRKQKSLCDEIESLKRVATAKDAELREIKVEYEDKRSLFTKLEQKCQKQEMYLRDNETKVKLVLEDNDEKQKIIANLRTNIDDLKLKLRNAMQESDNVRGDLQFKITQIETSNQRIESDFNLCQNELRKLKDVNFEVEIERDRYKRDYEQCNHQVQERQKIIDAMKTQVEDMRVEFETYKKNLKEQLSQSKEASRILEELKEELDHRKVMCEEIAEENEGLRDDNRHLKEKVEELRDDIEMMEKRHTEVMDEFVFECDRLQKKLNDAEQIINDKQRQLQEMDAHQRQQMDNYRRDIDNEKRTFEMKLNELEVKMKESIANANLRNRTDIDQNGQESNDNYEQQIEFLNSVIVDMQKKNDDLNHRIQILEEIGITEFEVTPPAGGVQSRARFTNGHVRRPRLYCDICDMFDLHDTEECPQQAMNFDETNSHSHYSQIRGHERPYCDHCEAFGHWTVNCVETETY